MRDLDAHSWVEAWFPSIGWVTFDPTPVGRAAALAEPTTAAPAGARRRPRPRRRRRARPARPASPPSRGHAVGARSSARRASPRCCSPAACVAFRRRRGRAPGAAARARARAAPDAPARPARARRCRRSRTSFARSPDAAGLRARAARPALRRPRRRADARPAPRPALRAGPRRRPARPAAGVVGAAAEAVDCAPRGGRTLDAAMADALRPLPARDAAARGRRLPRRDRPARARPATSIPTRPRSARRSAARYFRSRPVRGGAGRVRGARRARADQRLRALLPRPLAARAGPPEGRPQGARAGRRTAPGPRATTASTGTAHAPPRRPPGAISNRRSFRLHGRSAESGRWPAFFM